MSLIHQNYTEVIFMASIHGNPNLSDRLIGIIESHSDEIARGTVKKLQTSARTTTYHALSYDEMYETTNEVYQHLGRWLWRTSEEAVRAWWVGLGEKRRIEAIPLDEVLWALVLTKDRLLDYLDWCATKDSALELYQQQEFDRLIGHFFDRAACYVAEGYEHHGSRHESHAAHGYAR